MMPRQISIPAPFNHCDTEEKKEELTCLFQESSNREAAQQKYKNLEEKWKTKNNYPKKNEKQ